MRKKSRARGKIPDYELRQILTPLHLRSRRAVILEIIVLLEFVQSLRQKQGRFPVELQAGKYLYIIQSYLYTIHNPLTGELAQQISSDDSICYHPNVGYEVDLDSFVQDLKTHPDISCFQGMTESPYLLQHGGGFCS
jgi:hypothetical protein